MSDVSQLSPKLLYADVDTGVLRDDADKFFINWGMQFMREIIVHAEDVFVYTSTGRRTVDWS